MKQPIHLILTALIISILMVACSNSGDQNANTTSTEPPLASHVSTGETVNITNRTQPLEQTVAQIATPTLVPIEVINEASAQDQVLINLYQRVNPSVVNIEVTQRVSTITNFDGTGSGFVYDLEGHIITNAHVVQDATEILVTFSDGFLTTARVIGADDFSDIAIIQVDNVNPERLAPVTLGDSSKLLVGQTVVAIGNPFGLRSSMTRGIISAVGRALPSAGLLNQTNQRFNNPSIIQVDAPINPGNSGGPLLNYAGEVIGVNTAIRSESGTFQGVAFSVPVNTVKRVVPQLVQGQIVRYSWLGVETFNGEPGLSTAALAEELSLPVSNGIIIESVVDGSPAATAGLMGGTQVATVHGEQIRTGGDIIVAIDGVFLQDLDALLAYLVENTSPNDVVTVTVIRGTDTIDVEVELGIR